MDGFVRRWAARLCGDESGATVIEYALIASFMSIAIIGGVIALGDNLYDVYSYIESNIVPALGG